MLKTTEILVKWGIRNLIFGESIYSMKASSNKEESHSAEYNFAQRKLTKVSQIHLQHCIWPLEAEVIPLPREGNEKMTLNYYLLCRVKCL